MTIKEGDYVLLLAPDDKTFLIQVSEDKKLSTHLGMLIISDAIGKNYGDKISSQLGKEFYLLEATTWDKMMKIHRQTQIIYPKDASIILLMWNGFRISNHCTCKHSKTGWKSLYIRKKR